LCAVLFTLWLGLPIAAASAQTALRVVVTGLVQPVALVQDPLDQAVQLIVERAGRVRVLRGGSLVDQVFLDLSGEVTTDGERGLLGLAFPPDAAATGRLYVNFTNRQGHTVIARFTRSPGDALRADPASRFDLQWPDGRRFIEQPFSNHNGGTLRFGPDGYLYVGMGDGGAGNDPGHRAQNPRTLLGKMLRIDVSVPDGDPRGYRVPPDNPFLDGDPVAALGEIWAFGLRNPWKFSFDDPARGGTGALFIGDVGQGAREEIDVEPAGSGGRNYGWRNREGTLPGGARPPLPPAFAPLVDPVFDFGRSLGASVTGGYVYRGRWLGARYAGRYFFADFISGRVLSLGLAYDATGEAAVVDVIDHTDELGGTGHTGNVVSIDIDANGELYVVDFAGRVLRIEPPPSLVIDVRGSGRVRASPPGETCESTCVQQYTEGTVVQLTATATSNSRFVGWSGDEDCADGVVTIRGVVSCTARFTGAVERPPRTTPRPRIRALDRP
jgi:glucose/arabinose dehydrogenase